MGVWESLCVLLYTEKDTLAPSFSTIKLLLHIFFNFPKCWKIIYVLCSLSHFLLLFNIKKIIHSKNFLLYKSLSWNYMFSEILKYIYIYYILNPGISKNFKFLDLIVIFNFWKYSNVNKNSFELHCSEVLEIRFFVYI